MTGAQTERKHRKDHFELDEYQFAKAKKEATYVKRSQLLNQDVTIRKVQDSSIQKEEIKSDIISLMMPYVHKPHSPLKRAKASEIGSPSSPRKIGTPASPRKNRAHPDEKSPISPRANLFTPKIPLKEDFIVEKKPKEQEDFAFYLLPKIKNTSYANSPTNGQLPTFETSRRETEESPYVDYIEVNQRKSPPPISLKEVNSRLEITDLPTPTSPIKNMHIAKKRQTDEASPSSKSPRKPGRLSPSALRGISDYSFPAADTYTKKSPRKLHLKPTMSPGKIERSNTVHNITFNPMNIQRIDHEYVAGDQLLSNRYSGAKLSNTKHNMFRSFKTPR